MVVRRSSASLATLFASATWNADDLRTTIQAKHWMCGFPDKLVIVTVGQSVLSVYGNEELVNTFRDKLLASYPTAAAVYDEAINA